MKQYHWQFPACEVPQLSQQLSALEEQQPHFLLLESNGHHDAYSRFDWLCGWEAQHILSSSTNSLEALRHFHLKHQDWLLGHLSFELKNELETLQSRHDDPWALPHLEFFVPATLIYCRQGIIYGESDRYADLESLLQDLPPAPEPQVMSMPRFTFGLGPKEYQERINSLLREIQYGNIYEINFCLEAKAEGIADSPALYRYLNEQHQAPFTAFYRSEAVELLSFSPERYLRKHGTELISQPIKGTAPRDADPQRDRAQARALQASEKERAENVMIVDLVRNDLSRTASCGSVEVKELCGIYSFEAVHQMISTVQSELRENCDFVDALALSFPMGSMTGAPKYSALKLIDRYESFCRGLYAGSVGYISPEGDLDLSVVIRSILHQREQHFSSLRVGSAITIHCDPLAEYRECLLKAEKLMAQGKAQTTDS